MHSNNATGRRTSWSRGYWMKSCQKHTEYERFFRDSSYLALLRQHISGVKTGAFDLERQKHQQILVLWTRYWSSWMYLSEWWCCIWPSTRSFWVPGHPGPAWRWRMIGWRTVWQMFRVSSWTAALLEVVLHACTVCLHLCLCVTLRSVRARSPHCLCCSLYRCSPPSDIWQNLGIIGGKAFRKSTKTKYSLRVLCAESKV